MKFENTKALTEKYFKLLTGISKKTFNKMINILNIAKQVFFHKGGRKNKYSMEERLLMALDYFHIASNFGVNKITCIRNIHWSEDTLIKHPDF